MDMIFSTAYTNLSKKKTVANVVNANSEFDAMIEAIVANDGENMREWLEKIPKKKKTFLNELLKFDISVDVTLVP